MLDGVNDTDDDARRLVSPVARHPGEGEPDPVQRMARRALPPVSSNNRIRAFATILMEAGYASPIRTPRGEDIMAACGQLKSASGKGPPIAEGPAPPTPAPA